LISAIVLASSMLVLILVLALAREVRLRRALERLVARLLSLWRNHHAEKTILTPWITLLALLIVGCESGDERLARFAEHSNEQQARQNEQAAA
jgi:hypothetical protein